MPDHHVAMGTNELLAALFADRDDLDCLAFTFQAGDFLTRFLHSVRVEATAKTALCRHDDQKVSVRCTRACQEFRTLTTACGSCQVRDHACQTFGIRLGSFSGFLRTAELRCSDHLFGLCDLLCGFHRSDPAFEILQAWHVSSPVILRFWQPARLLAAGLG